LHLSSQGKVDRPILIDEPKEFFERSKRTEHRRCGCRWQVLLCEFHIFSNELAVGGDWFRVMGELKRQARLAGFAV